MASEIQSNTVTTYTPSQVVEVLKDLIVLPSGRVCEIFKFCSNSLLIFEELQSMLPKKSPSQSQIASSSFQLNFICLKKLISEIQSIATRVLSFSENLSGKPARIQIFEIRNLMDCQFFVRILKRAASTLRNQFISDIKGTEWEAIADNIPLKSKL